MVEKVARMRMRLREASTTRSSPSISAMSGLRSSAYDAAVAAAAVACSAATEVLALTAEPKLEDASAPDMDDTAAAAADDHVGCEPVETCAMKSSLEWQQRRR